MTYRADTSACVVPLIGQKGRTSIHNLRESLPVRLLPPAPCELALQAALSPLAERLKKASCQTCLSDWFTRFANGASAFSARLMAYPLRFVNVFMPEKGFSASSLENVHAFQLCMSSCQVKERRVSYPQGLRVSRVLVERCFDTFIAVCAWPGCCAQATSKKGEINHDEI